MLERFDHCADAADAADAGGDLDGPSAQRSLGFLLRSAYQLLADEVYRQLHAAGFPEVRVAHSAVLRHIRPSGSRVTELADRAGITKQSMGYLVDHLVAHGYAELVPDPSDGRARLVKLSRRGRKLVDTLLRLSTDAEVELGRTIGESNLRVLRAGLERFVLGEAGGRRAAAVAGRQKRSVRRAAADKA